MTTPLRYEEFVDGLGRIFRVWYRPYRSKIIGRINPILERKRRWYLSQHKRIKRYLQSGNPLGFGGNGQSSLLGLAGEDALRKLHFPFAFGGFPNAVEFVFHV